MPQPLYLLLSAILLGVLAAACRQTPGPPSAIRADFSRITEIQDSIQQDLGVWGGSDRRKLPAVREWGAAVTVVDRHLRIHITQPGGWVRLAPEVVGLPTHWGHTGQLTVTARTVEGEGRLIVGLVGTRGRLQDTVELGRDPLVHAMNIREAALLGGLDARVVALAFLSPDTGTIAVIDLRVDTASAPTALIDRFGQRALVSYPDKLADTSEYRTDRNREAVRLNELPPPPATDAYGGLTGTGLTFAATGYFRTARAGARWYLVSPAGNPFYSFGLNGVRLVSNLNNAALTRVAGREKLFTELPDTATYAECYREGGAYLSWYCKNAIDKYGSTDNWRRAVLSRLARVGFNTIGNWSDSLLYGRTLAYTYTLDTRGGGRLGTPHPLPDVFDPAWERYVDSTFSRIEKVRNDPYLLGYFVDNEMHWGEVLDMDSTTYTYARFAELSDADQRLRAYANRYFGTIVRTLKKYDPNHLYLGCRFTRRLAGIEPIVAVAGKSVDVLSINMYSPFTRAETDAWYGLVGRPMLIGEHHVPPVDPSHLLPRYPAFHSRERDAMVRDYLREWVSYPYAVGSHWYQFADQEVSGRGDGGENQPVGLVSVVDRVDWRLARLLSELYGEIARSKVEPVSDENQ